jgi:hypothetical protein
MTDTDMAVVQKFYELAAEAERIDSEVFDEPVEPAFEAVLFYVLSHPESRQSFVNAFLQLARDPQKGPPELVQYCMHALRWDEVRRELVVWLEVEGSERVKHILRKLIMSFDDDWYDADAYARFSGET